MSTTSLTIARATGKVAGSKTKVTPTKSPLTALGLASFKVAVCKIATLRRKGSLTVVGPALSRRRTKASILVVIPKTRKAIGKVRARPRRHKGQERVDCEVLGPGEEMTHYRKY